MKLVIIILLSIQKYLKEQIYYLPQCSNKSQESKESFPKNQVSIIIYIYINIDGTTLTPAVIPETPGEETLLNDVNLLTNKYRGSINFGSNSSRFEGVQIIKKKSKKEKSFRKKKSFNPIEETKTLNIMYNTMSNGFADKSTNSFGVD